MKLRPDEIRLNGQWRVVGGRMAADAVCDRIQALIQDHLEKVATTGWETLYRDPHDGRLWELLYPQSEMHGGGPPTLSLIDETTARGKYAYAPRAL